MKNYSQNATKLFLSKWFILSFGIVLVFQNCSKVSVSDVPLNKPASSTAALAAGETAGAVQTTNATADAIPGVLQPQEIICDSLNNDQTTIANGGLKGSIHYKPEGDLAGISYTQIADYLIHGTKASQQLFLSQLNIPTQRFSKGFAKQDGTLIQKDNGEVLVEYFGLHLESVLKLKAGNRNGKYQLALLSDDGSILQISGTDGQKKTLINNDSYHSARLACASNLISMNEKTRIPITIDYFQGPREHIALMLLWRVVSEDILTVPAEEWCGKGGSDPGLFFDSNTVPSTPQKPYLDLISRGWAPVDSGNFELPNRALNPCR